MGSDVRIVVGPPVRAGVPSPPEAADAVEALLREYDATLSRFRPDSELSRLNVDPREVVPASALLRAASTPRSRPRSCPAASSTRRCSTASRRPATAGRSSRLAGSTCAARCARPRGARRSAHPDPRARWRLISVDDVAGTITRPVGLRLDTGGTGKGHAADLAAELLDGYAYWMVDCGGDVRVGRRRQLTAHRGGQAPVHRPRRRRAVGRATAAWPPPGCAPGSGAGRPARSPIT